MSEEKKKYVAADARAALRQSLGLDPVTDGSDYDGDGKVTSADARAILRASVDLPDDSGTTPESASQIASQMGGSFVPASSADLNKAAFSAYEKYKTSGDNYEYNYNSDPLYQQIKNDYVRTGTLGAENIAGKAQAQTGGYGNSYAQTAAQQVFQDAMLDLNDVAVDLEQQAYGRHLDRQQQNLNEYSMLTDMANTSYNKEMTAAQLAAEFGDYSRFGKMLGLDLTQYATDAKAQQALNWGLQTGDFSKLASLGYDTSYLQETYDLNLKGAQLGYAGNVADITGDLSALEQYGYSTEDIQKAKDLNFALTAAANGDFSHLEKVGIDPTYMEESALREAAAYYAEYGDLSRLQSLGIDTNWLKQYNNALLAIQHGNAYTATNGVYTGWMTGGNTGGIGNLWGSLGSLGSWGSTGSSGSSGGSYGGSSWGGSGISYGGYYGGSGNSYGSGSSGSTSGYNAAYEYMKQYAGADYSAFNLMLTNAEEKYGLSMEEVNKLYQALRG